MAHKKVSRLRAFSVLFFVSLFFFYEFGLNNLFNALEMSLVSEFQLSPVKMGFLSSLYFYANIFFLLPAGLLLDHFSPKKLIIGAMLLCSFGVFLTGFTEQFFTLAVARLFMGIGGGFCFVGCIRVAANWYPDRRIALASGFIVSMGMFGGFIVQAPLSYLIDLYTWRGATMLVALIGLCVTFLIFIFVKDRPEGTPIIEVRAVTLKAMLKALKEVLQNKQNWLCGLYTSMMNLPIFILGSLWGIPYLVHVHALSELDAAHVCGLIFIGTMVGSLLINMLSNLLCSRKLPMLLGLMFAFVLILYSTTFMESPSVTELSWFFFILGLIVSAQVVSYPTVIESNSAELSGTATSVISILCLMGGAIASPLFGYLLMLFNTVETGSYHIVDPYAYEAAMNIIPIAFLIALISWFFICETFGDTVKRHKPAQATKGYSKK